MAARWLVVLLLWGLASYLIYRQLILPFTWDRGMLDWTINPLVRARGEDRLLIPIAVLGRYLHLLVAPWRLSLDYGAKVHMPTQSLSDPYLYLGIFAIIAWVVAFWLACARRHATASFCLVALALVYGLISNLIVLIGTVFGERLMYLPSVFFIILLCQSVARIRRRWLMAATVAVLVLFSLRTVSYAVRWQNRLEFLRWSAGEQPRSVLLQLLLIEEELAQDPPNLDAAESVAARARRMAPEHLGVWERSATVAQRRQDHATADLYRQKASEILLDELNRYYPKTPRPATNPR